LTPVRCVLSLCTIAVARDARAAGPSAPLPVRLVYEVASSSDECPTKERFASALVARSDKIALASGPGDSRTVTIAIAPRPTRDPGLRVWAGLFELTEPRTRARQRRIEGESCEEVAEALNVFAALALDPEARQGRIDTLPPAAPLRHEVTEQARPPPRRRAKPSVRPSDRPAFIREIGIGPSALVGYARRITPGIFLSGGLERAASTYPSAPVVDLALHLRVTTGLRASVASTPVTSARLTTVSLRVSPCPVRVTISPSIDGFACADGEIDHVSARAVGSATSQRELIAAAGGSAHVRVRLARDVRTEVFLGALVPYPRFAFYVDGHGLFAQSSLFGEVGLSTTFQF